MRLQVTLGIEGGIESSKGLVRGVVEKSWVAGEILRSSSMA